ncbi:MAG: arylsulfatase family protein [Verrucomicrobia bacterium]|nr:arylsulfatase family protein [Verrucomicrobiota bacterium]
MNDTMKNEMEQEKTEETEAEKLLTVAGWTGMMRQFTETFRPCPASLVRSLVMNMGKKLDEVGTCQESNWYGKQRALSLLTPALSSLRGEGEHLLRVGKYACAWFLLVFVAMLPGRGQAADSRPNVLFIIFDDWGWQHAGAYGCDWVKTPNFDRVAKEGILFKNAFTSNPKCSPCRASILTGRNTWQLEEAVSHNGLFPSKFAVYPDLLEQAGYTVGLTGKGWGPGDFKSTGFKRNPAGPSFDTHKVAETPAGGIGKNDYAMNFEAFLAQRPKDKPFSFWMGFQEPHRTYELNSGVRLGKKLEDVKVPAYLPDTPVVRGDLADYAIEVEYADAHIGKALQALEAAGELENTLVIVTSDHGMPFPYVKGQIHEDGFHLPLAMRWGKGIKPGRVVALGQIRAGGARAECDAGGQGAA